MNWWESPEHKEKMRLSAEQSKLLNPCPRCQSMHVMRTMLGGPEPMTNGVWHEHDDYNRRRCEDCGFEWWYGPCLTCGFDWLEKKG